MRWNASVAASVSLGAALAADAWPTRPVRVIVPYAAGGGPDVEMRRVAPELGAALDQAVVIENKVGAAGVLAANYVAQAAADGYTLLAGSNTHLIQKILNPDLKFDPLSDFVPVCNVIASPTVLVVRADSPYRTMAELVAAVRAKPGEMNYGSGGIGTSAHLAAAVLAALERLEVTHIPLRGSVEIAASLLRGDTQFAFPVAGTGVPQVRGGKLRALAVTSGARLKELPDVPTLHELLKNELAVMESWFGLWAPAGTPPSVVDTIHAAAVRALASPRLRAGFEANGGTAQPSASPQAFAAFVKSENAKWAEIVRLANVSTS